MNNTNYPLLMSPAGSFESLAAALRNGANAVYFGVGNLNMRSTATTNFEVEDLIKVVRLCHVANCKAYLTLNIVVYDDEIAEIERICSAAKNAGVDAVIVSDIAVVMIAKRINLPIHMSVQANVCNLESVRFYAQYAELVVLARELSLSGIAKIIEGIKAENITSPSGNLIKTEVFIHGAICAAVSGKCYMSLTEYNHSANRGECRQNCRHKYKITDLTDNKELELANGYVMSAADLCMIRFIPELIEAGINVFKIEGRGRTADYVAVTSRIYSQAIKSYLENTFSPSKAEELRDELKKVFNRNFWDGGYYLGEDMGVWSNSAGNQSPQCKTFAGKVSAYYPKLQVAEIKLLAGELSVGSKLLVIGKTTGAEEVTIEEMRCAGELRTTVTQGEVFTLKTPKKLRINDQVYLMTNRKFGKENKDFQ